MSDLSQPPLKLVPLADEPRPADEDSPRAEPFVWLTPPLACYPQPLRPLVPEPCVVEGHAALRIVEVEQSHDCDLVVLGKHGQSAAADLLLVSVTKHVLAEGSADVLVSTRRGS